MTSNCTGCERTGNDSPTSGNTDTSDDGGYHVTICTAHHVRDEKPRGSDEDRDGYDGVMFCMKGEN